MTELTVQVPPDTPAGDRLFLAGDAECLGPWRADALPLHRLPDGRHTATLDLAADERLLYLVTRGTSRSYRYGKFLVEEVKPFIDRTYRTLPGRKHTAVGGSSLGGLISLFLCKWYPEAFGLCAAVSPSLWWDRDLLLRSVAKD